mgnify:CR=1 FL=1
MQEIFKVGMEVYDQVNFPNMKGIVKDTHGIGEYCIEVRFNGSRYAHYYNLEGRLEKDQIPTLSTKPYKFDLTILFVLL